MLLPDGTLKAVEAQGQAREGFLEETKVICLKGSSGISQGRKEQAEGKECSRQRSSLHRCVREAGTGVGSELPVLGPEREVDPSQGASWAFLPAIDPDNQSGRLG